MNSTKLVDQSYTATEDDYYIGVDSQASVTITLPACEDGKQYIIKSEMKAPLLNRRIRIVTSDQSKIDGYGDALICVSHDSLWLMRRGGDWHTIK